MNNVNNSDSKINSTLLKKMLLLNNRWFNKKIDCPNGLKQDFYYNCKRCFGQATDMRENNGKDNYNCEYFSYYYICSHLNSFSSQILYALNSDFMRELKNLKSFNVLSLGCGSAPDFIAIDAFNEQHVDIKYTGVDFSNGWVNNQECIKVYCKNNNYSEPQFINTDVLDYTKEKRKNKFNIIILQSLLSTFKKVDKKEELKIFLSNFFNNIVLNSSENVYIIVSDINSKELYRDEWIMLLEELAKNNNFITKQMYLGGCNENGNFEYYGNNKILFEYPTNYDPDNKYSKRDDCMSCVQLLIKKG